MAEWLLRTLSFLLLVLLKILQPFFSYRDRTLPKVVPVDKNSLLRLSACEIAERIRNGLVSIFHIAPYTYLMHNRESAT